MSFFEEKSYRSVLKHRLEERKKIDPKSHFQAMATFMGIQKSYLSKVISGNADLNPDQLFLAGEFLQLDDAHQLYLGLLLELEKCAVKSRKTKLQFRLEQIRSKNRKTRAHLSAAVVTPGPKDLSEYYLDPLHALVHMALAIQRYATLPEGLTQLARDLSVSQKRLLESYRQLEKMGLVSVHGSKIEIKNPNLHLDAGSPLYRT